MPPPSQNALGASPRPACMSSDHRRNDLDACIHGFKKKAPPQPQSGMARSGGGGAPFAAFQSKVSSPPPSESGRPGRAWPPPNPKKWWGRPDQSATVTRSQRLPPTLQISTPHRLIDPNDTTGLPAEVSVPRATQQTTELDEEEQPTRSARTAASPRHWSSAEHTVACEEKEHDRGSAGFWFGLTGK
jgi:hypothetical protein